MSAGPRPFVFVVMPFDPSFDDLYQLGIKPACERAGAFAERVDEQIFQESILQRIYNQISRADVVVADVTGQNPNVFYEIGYAHALGKAVVLMARALADIPFDLKHYPHVIYGGSIVSVIPELEKRVRWAIENPETSAAPPLKQLRCSIGGLDLDGAPTILNTSHDRGGFGFQVDIHNSVEERIRSVTLQAAFVTSERVAGMHDQLDPPVTLNRVRKPDGNLIHVLPRRIEIVPGSWASVRLYANGEPGVRHGDIFDMVLRLFCDGTIVDYPFRVRCENPKLAD